MVLTLNCFMMPQEEKLGEAEKHLVTNSMYFNEHLIKILLLQIVSELSKDSDKLMKTNPSLH